MQTEQDAENLGRYFAISGQSVQTHDTGQYEIDGRRVMVRRGAFPVSDRFHGRLRPRTRAIRRDRRWFARELRGESQRQAAHTRRRSPRLFEGHSAPHPGVRTFPRQISGMAGQSDVPCGDAQEFASKCRNMRPHRIAKSTNSSDRSTVVTATPRGRRSVMSIAPIRGPRSPAIVSFSAGGACDAAARRHESRRQGICRRAGSRGSGRARALAICGRGAGTRRRVDHQSTRDRRHGRGDPARPLEMPLEERRERHAPMLADLLEYDIKKWAEDYLSTLVEGAPGRRLLEGIRALFGVSSLNGPLAFR